MFCFVYLNGMVNSLRCADKSLLIFCPRCNSKKVVKNGRHHQGKLQFFCTNCHKYFYKDPAKGYPPTKIPFPVIAYVLYFRRKNPAFSNMREYRRFVNHWLQHLRVSDQEVSRQTIHHWIDNFDFLLDKVISFDDTRNYCRHRLQELVKVHPPLRPIPYRRALEILERKFGKTTVVQLIKKDEDFFRELVGVVSKHGVFWWEFLDEDYLRSCRSQYHSKRGNEIM